MIEIEGRRNGFDPLREIFIDFSRPTEQDISVQERCGIVFNQALNVCCKLPDMSKINDARYPNEIMFCTPEIRYKVPDTNKEGYIWLGFSLPKKSSDLALDFDDEYDRVSCSLFYKPSSQPSDPWGHDQQLMCLTKDTLELYVSGYERAGGHEELNYLWGIIEDICEEAFPKKPKSDLY